MSQDSHIRAALDPITSFIGLTHLHIDQRSLSNTPKLPESLQVLQVLHCLWSVFGLVRFLVKESVTHLHHLNSVTISTWRIPCCEMLGMVPLWHGITEEEFYSNESVVAEFKERALELSRTAREGSFHFLARCKYYNKCISEQLSADESSSSGDWAMRRKAPRRISAYVSMCRLEIGMYVFIIIEVVHADLWRVQSIVNPKFAMCISADCKGHVHVCTYPLWGIFWHSILLISMYRTIRDLPYLTQALLDWKTSILDIRLPIDWSSGTCKGRLGMYMYRVYEYTTLDRAQNTYYNETRRKTAKETN